MTIGAFVGLFRYLRSSSGLVTLTPYLYKLCTNVGMPHPCYAMALDDLGRPPNSSSGSSVVPSDQAYLQIFSATEVQM